MHESRSSAKKEAAQKGSLFLWCERWNLLHYGVDSVEPKSSKSPLDTCISLFYSHPHTKKRPSLRTSSFLVRVFL